MQRATNSRSARNGASGNVDAHGGRFDAVVEGLSYLQQRQQQAVLQQQHQDAMHAQAAQARDHASMVLNAGLMQPQRDFLGGLEGLGWQYNGPPGLVPQQARSLQMPQAAQQAPDEGTTRRRSSQYRGVTRHRRSGRWEAHIWIKEIGRQVYLGGYEKEEHAAEAYDVAALKCKGKRVKTNFNASRYSDLVECMNNISLEELIMAVRRQSQGFSRGTSSYRGVTHHPSGRWESRIGIPGSKHIYLGLFREEQEAARAYDQALVRLRGASASTNFALSDYRQELAEYHRMQQAVLMGDESWADYMDSGAAYERWIKYGTKEINKAAEGAEAGAGARAAPAPQDAYQQAMMPAQGLAAGVPAARIGAKSRKRSRSDDLEESPATMLSPPAATAALLSPVAHIEPDGSEFLGGGFPVKGRRRQRAARASMPSPTPDSLQLDMGPVQMAAMMNAPLGKTAAGPSTM